MLILPPTLFLWEGTAPTFFLNRLEVPLSINVYQENILKLCEVLVYLKYICLTVCENKMSRKILN